MQTSRLQQVLYVHAIRKIFIRQVATSNVAVKLDSDTTQNLKSWKEIPGLPSVPIIGPLLNFLPIVGSVGTDFGYKFMDDIYKKYGPLVRFDGLFGRLPFIFVYDPDCAEQVLRSENYLPIRQGFESLKHFRKYYAQKTKQSLDGLLTENDEKWKAIRSTVNPVLLQPKTIKLYTKVLDEVALDMVNRIKDLRNDKYMITENFEVEVNKWALESIATVALGTRIGCLSPNLTEDSPAWQLIQNGRDVIDISNQLDFQPSFWRWFATPTFKKAMKVYEHQIDLSKIFLNEAVKKIKNRKTPIPDDQKGVLEKLLEVDVNIATVMSSDMLFAGVDATAHTAIATLYLLASNPEKQQRLRDEILSTSLDDRRSYLKGCIKESMRLMPVVGGNSRITTKEINLMGYHIPKNIGIIIPHEHMSRQEEYYPKPEEFIPERWVVEKGHPLHHYSAPRFVTSPFGFGVRSCIGRRIAELEMETFLARVVEHFELEWTGGLPERVTTTLTYMRGPFNFIFKDAKTN